MGAVKLCDWIGLRRRAAEVLAAALLVLALQGWGHGQIPGVSIAPSDVALSPSHPTELLRLRNQTGDAIRYQVDAYSWAQTADGRQVLAATEDLIFFPPLFNVGAGDEQIIRVAAGVPFGLKEQSYRLFIEQLPPLAKPEDGDRSKVRLLMRVGLPVFLQPSNVADGAAMGAAEVKGGVLRFTVENTGNVHLVTSDVRVSGLGSDGKTVFDRSAQPSYVPADASLNFTLPISPKDCPQLRTVSVSVRTEQQAPGRDFNTKRSELTKSIRLGPDSCAPAGKGTGMPANSPS